MIKIRLARGGKKNQPFYRIVAIEKSRKRGGAPLEILGTYDPSKKKLELKKDKLKAWTEKGAQLSDAVRELLK